MKRELRYGLLVVFLFLLSWGYLWLPHTRADISGEVTDLNDIPLSGVNISVFQGFLLLDQVSTDSSGDFQIELPDGDYSCQVYAGIGYLPSIFNVKGSLSNANLQLSPGAAIRLDGDLQYVDTEQLPLHVDILVHDNRGELINETGFPLVFGTETTGLNRVKWLPSNVILIPSDSTVSLSVNGSYLIDRYLESRRLVFDVGTVAQGETANVDLRRFTIQTSEQITAEVQEKLEHSLDEMNRYGFFLARQEAEHSTGVRFVEESDALYSEDEYGASFDSLKRAYIAFVHANSELESMYNEARYSVVILIGFLALCSSILGYLTTDESGSQLVVSFLAYLVSILLFYLLYPGSRIVSVDMYATYSIGFLVVVTIIVRVFPMLFTFQTDDGRIHTRNLLSPIFRLAKRSLRRRRLRFLLTLISLTLLVMSFVTLTSFSEGYGIVSGRDGRSSWRGVYIRDGNWLEYEPSFIQYSSQEIEWLLNQEEVLSLFPKAENVPSRRPLTNIGNSPIYGIISGSVTEFGITGLESVLISGDLPDEGVLISQTISQNQGINIGDMVTIGSLSITVDGVFDDSQISDLEDLDGTPYLSEKWVDISPEGEAPVWTLQHVPPEEQVISSIENSNLFSSVGVQRVGLALSPSTDGNEFAERLALERGYRSYSSTAEGITLYRLGNYFDGKGASLVIPWVIVVLNVIVTMLNSMFERKGEIEILSSIGLNPAQVSAVFVAEATISGFIAGGLGYLLGLGFYKALAVLNIGLQVHQKISAVWSLASIGLAVSAVLTGAFAALRNSTVITPSLMRRWRIDRTIGGYDVPWTVTIPVVLEQGEIPDYLGFIEDKLRPLETHLSAMTTNIKVNHDLMQLSFIYKSVQTSTGNLYTKNLLRVILEEGEYKVVMESTGDIDYVHLIGSMIRRFTMDYTTGKDR